MKRNRIEQGCTIHLLGQLERLFQAKVNASTNGEDLPCMESDYHLRDVLDHGVKGRVEGLIGIKF